MDVAPLAHPAWADKAVAQALLLLAVGQLVGGVGRGLGWCVAAAFFDPVPQLQDADKLGTFVVELLVPLVCGLRRLLWPVTHILP